MKPSFFRLASMNETERSNLNKRSSVKPAELIKTVAPILEAIKDRGDEAVLEYTKLFDKVDMSAQTLRVTQRKLTEAVNSLEAGLKEALRVSIANITKFHEKQLEPATWEMEISPGVVAGEKSTPIASVGLYIPRGKGSFPSMMMMAGVPAKVAGVKRIVVITPPDANGDADPATIAAAEIMGINEVYAVGGVQAVGALAYGTQTIAKVDKIVGPGSGYVLAAKLLLSTELDTGLPAGPSESIVLADGSVSVELAVTDLLIEAEHGPDSAAYLVTYEEDFALKALEALPQFTKKLPHERRSYCETVLQTNGGVILAEDLDDAIKFINDYAPEHLQILTRDPELAFKKTLYAGEALIGPYTPGTLANYSIGPNAILPTSRFARTASALSTRDFVHKMSFARVNKQGFASLASQTLALAEYEGFAAHAAALKFRLDE